MDDQHFVTLELALLANVFAKRVGVGSALAHDEQHWLLADLAVQLVMLTPAFQGHDDPIVVGADDVFRRHFRRVFPLHLMDDQGRLDDRILNRLGQRVINHNPGEVGAALSLGRGREVEPQI